MSIEVEFRATWAMWAGRDRVAQRWADSLVSRHHEPWRHYHTLQHVVAALRQVRILSQATPHEGPDGDPGSDTGSNLDCVVAAVCFHDAIYDPRAAPGVNEHDSARLAADALTELGWDDVRTAAVRSLIEATADHESDGSVDCDLVIAADLSILAADPITYSDYVVQVRKEYDFVDHAQWVIGRAAVLNRFLEREHLFPVTLEARSTQTHTLIEEWDRRARANISAELAALVSGGE